MPTEITHDDARAFALAFLDAAIRAGRGPVTFTTTEDGDVGVILFDVGEAAEIHGWGDTAEEALIHAAYRGLFPELESAAIEPSPEVKP